MYARREDSRLRVPSPAPTRRQYRTRDVHSAGMDDHFFDARGSTRARDPSPGGMGRLSTSAPPGSDMSFFTRRYPPRYPDSASYVTSASSGYASSGSYSSSRKRETSPRTSGGTPSSSSRHVNGAMLPGSSLPPAHPARSRPRSFPEQRGGSYLPDYHAGHHAGYYATSRSRDMSPEFEGSRGHGQHHGYYDGSFSRSPNDSEEALSSVTLTAERAAQRQSGDGAGAEHLAAEGSFTCDDGYTWHTALTCYLCGQLFHRPRILPCGHTFCSDCLVQLKDEYLREGRGLSPGSGPSACTWEGRHRTDIGAQLACPMPDCNYSMRLMNLSRWSTRNKTVTDTIVALRRLYEQRQDACTQTDITMDSMLVTIPRSLIHEAAPPGGDDRSLAVRRNSTTLVDRMVHRALSMDSLSRTYIPQQHVTWRSYAAMLGMHILQQVIHT